MNKEEKEQKKGLWLKKLGKTGRRDYSRLRAMDIVKHNGISYLIPTKLVSISLSRVLPVEIYFET